MNDRLKYLISHTRAGTYFSTKFLTMLLDPSPLVAQSLKMADKYLDENKPIFYVSGALTNMEDPSIIARYERTGELIREMGGLSYLPHEHGSDPKTNPELTPDDIYTIDFLWGSVLARAEIMWGYPASLGVGVQLGWCDTYQIPTALLQPADVKLSRVAEAIAQRVTVIRYTDDPKSWEEPMRAYIKDWIGRNSTNGMKGKR